MQKLTRPTVDDTRVFDALIAAKRSPRKEHLKAVKADVLAAYRDYTGVAPEVGSLRAVQLTLDQAQSLIHAYEAETVPMAELRAILTKPILAARCPFCGLSEASTLDHYLPKEKTPQFAVFSRNLVPCCPLCNTRKRDLVVAKSTNVRQFVHPYFDHVPSLQFVGLNVNLLRDALELDYWVRRPQGMPEKVFQQLKSHFTLLDLGNRYRKMSLVHLRDQRAAFDRFYGAGHDAAQVARELLIEAQGLEAKLGPNNWRVVLCRSLAASHSFCDGGFDVLDRIQ